MPFRRLKITQEGCQHIGRSHDILPPHLMATPTPTTKDVAAQCMVVLDEIITKYGELLATFQGSISSSHKTKKSKRSLKDRQIRLVPTHGAVLPSTADLMEELNSSLPDEPANPQISWVLAYLKDTLRLAKGFVEDADGVELYHVVT
jgi:hypothetical protein